MINNMKSSAFGGKLQIIRFILILSPIVWMCFPMYDYLKFDLVDDSMELVDVSLITLIQSIIAAGNNDATALDVWMSDKAHFYILILIILITVFSMFGMIFSLFSVGKGALIRNMLFNAICCIVITCVSILPLNDSLSTYIFSSSIGIRWVLLSYFIMFSLHKEVDKKLNPSKYDNKKSLVEKIHKKVKK